MDVIFYVFLFRGIFEEVNKRKVAMIEIRNLSCVARKEKYIVGC